MHSMTHIEDVLQLYFPAFHIFKHLTIYEIQVIHLIYTTLCHKNKVLSFEKYEEFLLHLYPYSMIHSYCNSDNLLYECSKNNYCSILKQMSKNMVIQSFSKFLTDFYSNSQIYRKI
jgi:hypothetical protein